MAGFTKEQNLGIWKETIWHICTSPDIDIQPHLCIATCLQLLSGTASPCSYWNILLGQWQHTFLFSLLLLLLILFPTSSIYYIVLLTKGGERNHWSSFPLSLIQIIHLILYEFILHFLKMYCLILHLNFKSSILSSYALGRLLLFVSNSLILHIL